MLLVYDKTRVEIAYGGVKATISGESKSQKEQSSPHESGTEATTQKSDGTNQSAPPPRSDASMRISTGDQSIIVVGNSAPVSIKSKYAEKH